MAGVALEAMLILAIDYTAWGNQLFGTTPIDGATWLYMLPFVGAMLALEEGRKWWVRTRALQSTEHIRRPPRRLMR